MIRKHCKKYYCIYSSFHLLLTIYGALFIKCKLSIEKKKQLSIEQRVRIDFLAAEGFSQQSIAKKLGISKFGVQYSLQRKTETGVNEDRKRMKIQGVDLNFWPVVYIYIYNTVGKSVLLKCLITKLELELKYEFYIYILMNKFYNKFCSSFLVIELSASKVRQTDIYSGRLWLSLMVGPAKQLLKCQKVPFIDYLNFLFFLVVFGLTVILACM